MQNCAGTKNMHVGVKTGLFAAMGLLSVSGIAVFADYFGLFGIHNDTAVDFSEVRFRTIDADNGRLILNVRAKCTQKGNDNACTNRDSHMAGIIAIQIPLHYQLESTRLFEKSRSLIKAKDPYLHVFFIHPDYYTLNQMFQIEDLINQQGNEVVINMKPRNWDDPES